MLQSKLFTKTSKDAPKDETSFNAQILMRAGFIDKLAAGIYTFLPLGLRVHEKIKNIIRQEINLLGGQEILMPALTPKENWQATGRWDNFDVLFKLKGGDDKEYALAATHEEVVTPAVAKHVFSYRDLPVAVYQFQTKFRNELRAKAGLLRGREFSMKDLYSFHADQTDLDKYYEQVIETYHQIYRRLGLADLTYVTYASGGAFAKYSHEFQTVAEAGEDTIFACEQCRAAVNKEIIDEQSTCPICGSKDLVEKKAIEVGNIFKLGRKFTDAFGFTFKDAAGNDVPPVMGCYGIGPSRLMGTLAEIFHDERGLVWPVEVAPFAVHLLSLNPASAKATAGEARTMTDKIYQDLIKVGVEVLYDDREDKSAGEKFAASDLIGCPTRVLVSEKTLAEASVEVKNRATGEIKIIKIDELVNELKILANK